MKEKKSINISDFIVQNLNDNKDKLKECLNFIISEKLKDQYETILFHINIWNYYVFNKYQLDFLTFLEINLYKQAINSKDIYDCIEFSSNFRSKSFSSLLEIIKYNFDKIQNILKNENTNINIEKYIYQQPQSDDLLKIKELLKAIIEKELLSLHCSIIFNENIWVPYIQTNDLNILRLIRIIFYECKKMQPTLNEDVIALPKKIHDAGFNEIQKGILIDNKMLEFLGNEEAFYVDKQINVCQAQTNNNTLEINNLKVENVNLKQQLNNANASIVNLGKENTLLRNTINNLQTQINTLSREFSDVTARCSKLESKVRSLEWRS
jgi:FtsZ-binding cell division protein ZapB